MDHTTGGLTLFIFKRKQSGDGMTLHQLRGRSGQLPAQNAFGIAVHQTAGSAVQDNPPHAQGSAAGLRP